MITRCRKCNKKFDNKGVLGLNKCPECSTGDISTEAKRAKLVRDIVKENPKISTAEVSTMTGFSTKDIVNYIKGEFLEISDDSEAYLRCEDCGAEIKTGRQCVTCKAK